MSLLLDALKRAEQEKQSRPGEGHPVHAAKPALELAPIKGPDHGRAGPAGPVSPPVAAAPPISKPAATTGGSRKVLWIGAAIVTVAIVVGVGYVWYSISSLGPSPAVRTPVARPIVATPVATAPAPAEPAPAAVAPSPMKAEAHVAPAPPLRAPQRVAPEPDRVEPVPAMLQPTRVADRPRIAPEVSAGYAALRRGDLGTARKEYQAALSADNANLDAALGLATVEARAGKGEAAAALYRRALEIDPRNATAIAGLAALTEAARPEALEQHLLREISQHPNSASLQVLLGNAYAAQSLWMQAQSAYFEAHRLDPGNPDIAYNLAVSLDRIGQPALAAKMYHRALDAAGTQSGQFDAGAVQRRLAEIATPAPTRQEPPTPR